MWSFNFGVVFQLWFAMYKLVGCTFAISVRISGPMIWSIGSKQFDDLHVFVQT